MVSFRSLVPAAVLGLALSCLSREAGAIPAFARKYDAPCGLCHYQSYPALNPFGFQFKENGYQYQASAEESFRERAGAMPNPDERLLILNDLPLALRAQSALAGAVDPRANGENGTELRPFESLFLLAGASIYPGVSFFAATTLIPDVAIHHAAIGFHGLLFGPEALNLRVGRLLLLDHQRPEHRSLTRFANPTGTTALGLSPVVLDSTQHGVEAFGRLPWWRTFYRVGLAQGAQAEDGVSDKDSHKDVFGELHVTPHHRLTLGTLGYLGKTQITDDRLGIEARFSDRFWMATAFAGLRMNRFDVFAQGVRVEHENPAGDDEHDGYWGVRAELRATLSPRMLLVARYDELVTHHDESLEARQVTMHLDYLVLTNLRIGLESSVALRDIEKTGLFLLLDVAL